MLSIAEQLSAMNVRSQSTQKPRQPTPFRKMVQIAERYLRCAPKERLPNGLGTCVKRDSPEAYRMYLDAIKSAMDLGFSKDEFHDQLGLLIERKRKKELKNAEWRARHREHMRDYAQRRRDEIRAAQRGKEE